MVPTGDKVVGRLVREKPSSLEEGVGCAVSVLVGAAVTNVGVDVGKCVGGGLIGDLVRRGVGRGVLFDGPGVDDGEGGVGTTVCVSPVLTGISDTGIGVELRESSRALVDGPGVGFIAPPCESTFDASEPVSGGPSHNANNTPVKSPAKAIQLNMTHMEICLFVTKRTLDCGNATGRSLVATVRELS